jgi:hypothetical protein
VWIYSPLIIILSLQVEVFCVVTPCSFVVGYQILRGPCCLHLLSFDAVWCCGRIATFQMVLQNVGILPQHYTASQLRRPRLESSPLSEPEISHRDISFDPADETALLNNQWIIEVFVRGPPTSKLSLVHLCPHRCRLCSGEEEHWPDE